MGYDDAACGPTFAMRPVRPGRITIAGRSAGAISATGRILTLTHRCRLPGGKAAVVCGLACPQARTASAGRCAVERQTRTEDECSDDDPTHPSAFHVDILLIDPLEFGPHAVGQGFPVRLQKRMRLAEPASWTCSMSLLFLHPPLTPARGTMPIIGSPGAIFLTCRASTWCVFDPRAPEATIGRSHTAKRGTGHTSILNTHTRRKPAVVSDGLLSNVRARVRR